MSSSPIASHNSALATSTTAATGMALTKQERSGAVQAPAARSDLSLLGTIAHPNSRGCGIADPVCERQVPLGAVLHTESATVAAINGQSAVDALLRHQKKKSNGLASSNPESSDPKKRSLPDHLLRTCRQRLGTRRGIAPFTVKC
jgi:hypothetical protein